MMENIMNKEFYGINKHCKGVGLMLYCKWSIIIFLDSFGFANCDYEGIINEKVQAW